MSSRFVVLISVAAVVAVAAATAESAGVAVVGAALALGLAVAHPALRDPRVPRVTRWLLRGALLLSVAAVVALLWRWPASLLSVRDPQWQWQQFRWHATVAGCLLLACGCLAVAVSRLPRDRLRHLGLASPTVVPLTLLVLVLVPVIVSLVGPITAAAEVLCVLGGYAWLVRRTAQRHGAAAIVVAGTTPLALLTWFMVDEAWRSWPEPPRDDVFYAVAVAIDGGPDVESGSVLAALLLGAVLTALACARLARGEPAAV
ncbi:hypothetical protein Ais01nite_64210 [Asanoa ishikariensis]|uniref:Uncharacterized protein n=1 Tax=Asanoa ishikariensis TaxID=137265 RepID=A0A1H3NT05_9ACTN|nr:hypothetical protein [Asanoa ishikariensis]GIF68386.1 hypothetical protein Ais01nite_64210 [Asanoa ishikariensis]SDY91928.1 hypothetical protein SAMN05421684_2302 [Asanoa ishikariensis]